jgi:hypothetical protein
MNASAQSTLLKPGGGLVQVPPALADCTTPGVAVNPLESIDPVT